jgi:hypothetical protein
MKIKLIFVIFLLIAHLSLLTAQIPQGFNYQAVARLTTGDPIINTTLPVRITIQADSLGTSIIWQELHNSVTTNGFGLMTLILGKGARQTTSTVPTFSAIDWSVTPKFIKTEINYSGWKTMGVTRFWSVPYSKIAENLGGPVKKLAVSGTTLLNDEALFEVKNKDGNTVFAVYNEGVRVYVADGAKGLKGGFAVGGFGTDKAESQKYLVVSKDSTRIYIDNNPLTKKLKGGFAVGGYDIVKGAVMDYLDINPDSIRIYIDTDPSTKKLKGGFAVGGYDMTKGATVDYLNVAADATGIINPSQNRILWYPLKNAFLTGKVLIESSENVGENSFASGFESKAKGGWSQALGYKAIANGDYSTAIGKNAVANNINSFAFGENAQAKNGESYALGRGAIAEGFRSFAFGSAGIDSAGQTTGVAYAKGNYSVAIGQGSQAIGQGAFTVGLADTAKGEFSTSIGYKSSAIGNYSVAVGKNTRSSGSYSLSLGYYTQAIGDWSTALGDHCKAGGHWTTAIGYNTEARGNISTSMGYKTLASGFYSTAMGSNTVAGGMESTAMGYGTSANGPRSTSMGYNTRADGNSSTAMGIYTTASGAYSISAGSYTVASGGYSSAFGDQTTASGLRAFSIGYLTSASANQSIAMGVRASASGQSSFALGVWALAPSYNEIVIGSYNTDYTPISTTSWEAGDRLFVIGNGTFSAKSNAITVLKNGCVGLQTVTIPTYALELPNNSALGIGQARAYAWATYSDGRAKSDQKTLSYGLEEILHLQPSEYFHHSTVSGNNGIEIDDIGKHDIGLIAQDVYSIIPEAVNKPENEEKELWSISYDKLVPVLINAIKEQQQQIDELKALVEKLISQK